MPKFEVGQEVRLLIPLIGLPAGSTVVIEAVLEHKVTGSSPIYEITGVVPSTGSRVGTLAFEERLEPLYWTKEEIDAAKRKGAETLAAIEWE